jgi:hypothetical protein
VPSTLKSMPVWRMALPQESPSMPTQAEDEYSVREEPPLGSFGDGTVKVPVTDLYVPCRARVSGCVR